MTQALLNAISGTNQERYPIWFLRQAGRYLPEYQALRKNRSFLELCSNPKLAGEVTLQPLARFDLDAAIIFADILLPLMPLGQDLSFKKDHGPLLTPPIRSKEDFNSFVNKRPEVNSLNYVGEAISLVRAKLDKSKSVIGFAGAPFTVASYMIEGGGSKNFHHCKKLLFSSPETFSEIMSLLTKTTVKYLTMQAQAGCDIIMLFDSWAGALSPLDYKEHILPHMKTLRRELKQLKKPLIYYPGANPYHTNLMDESVCDVLHLDWRVDLKSFFEKPLTTQKTLSFQGNLDPQALFLDESSLRRRVRDVLEHFQKQAPHKHIFNVGHGLIPQTPIDSIKTVIDEIRSFKK